MKNKEQAKHCKESKRRFIEKIVAGRVCRLLLQAVITIHLEKVASYNVRVMNSFV